MFGEGAGIGANISTLMERCPKLNDASVAALPAIRCTSCRTPHGPEAASSDRFKSMGSGSVTWNTCPGCGIHLLARLGRTLLESGPFLPPPSDLPLAGYASAEDRERTQLATTFTIPEKGV